MDPITLALLGGGSSLLGAFLNNSAQDKVNNARNQVINDERGRQQGFDTEAGKVNDQSLGRYSNFGDQQSAKAAQLADYFKTPVTTPNTIAALPPVTSDLVQREVDAKNGIAQNYVGHQADALGNMRSFGDLFGGIQRGQARDAQTVGQIGSFKKGSSGVEALELDNANRAGNADKGWADLLTGFGKVGLTAALAGQYVPDPVINADGSIGGAEGPTSVGGRPLVGVPARFGANASRFLTYGR